MKLVCPVCHAEFLLQAALNDVDARKAVVKAFQLTDMGMVLINYTALFKPAKQALSMGKLVKLLDELVPMVKEGQIARNGTLYPAPQAYWQQAMETMIANRDNLVLPLKGHGYLLEVIAGYANKANAQAERRQEQGRNYGKYHTATPNAVPTTPVVAFKEPAPKQRSFAPSGWRGNIKKGNKNESNP